MIFQVSSCRDFLLQLQDSLDICENTTLVLFHSPVFVCLFHRIPTILCWELPKWVELNALSNELQAGQMAFCTGICNDPAILAISCAFHGRRFCVEDGLSVLELQ